MIIIQVIISDKQAVLTLLYTPLSETELLVIIATVELRFCTMSCRFYFILT